MVIQYVPANNGVVGDFHGSTHKTDAKTFVVQAVMLDMHAMEYNILMNMCPCFDLNCFIDTMNILKTIGKHNNDGKKTTRKCPSSKH